MNGKLIRLAERRERLIAQARSQRSALAQSIEPWRTPLTLADRGLKALRYLKGHPQWIAGGIAILAAIGPRRAGWWLGRGWISLRVLHGLRGRNR